MKDQDAAAPAGAVQIVQLAGTFEAFGMVIDFLSRTPPFADFETRTVANAVRHQLGDGQHLAAMAGTRMVGYAGWMLTTEEIARAWAEARGELRRVPAERATAAALTIVAVTDPAVTRRLIRGARTLNPGKRAYFKRGTEGGPQPPRKASVLIVSGTSR